jgi:hypothetical protein
MSARKAAANSRAGTHRKMWEDCGGEDGEVVAVSVVRVPPCLAQKTCDNLNASLRPSVCLICGICSHHLFLRLLEPENVDLNPSTPVTCTAVLTTCPQCLPHAGPRWVYPRLGHLVQKTRISRTKKNGAMILQTRMTKRPGRGHESTAMFLVPAGTRSHLVAPVVALILEV